MSCNSCPVKSSCSDAGSIATSATCTPACTSAETVVRPPAPVCIVTPPPPTCKVTVVTREVTDCCPKCIYSGSLENKYPTTVCDCSTGQKVRVCPEHMPLPNRINFYADEPLTPEDCGEDTTHPEPPPSRTGGSDVDPCCALVCPPPKPGCCPQFSPNVKSCGC